jgi:serine/threonine protein kinase
VLVNDREQALLCDFGIRATHTVGALRWMAPELLAKDQYVPTMASDIYSFGMTCYVSNLLFEDDHESDEAR